MFEDFEGLSFLQELEEFLNKIEEKNVISKEDLLKIEEDIKNLKVITEKILKIINDLLYIVEKQKREEKEDVNISRKILFKKLPKDTMTPQDFYIIPILETLYELGGRGEVKKILSVLETKMKGILKEVDYEIDNSGTIRWIHNVHWCRLKLVHNGLLKKDSPRGIWELSEEGYKYIQEYLKHRRDEEF